MIMSGAILSFEVVGHSDGILRLEPTGSGHPGQPSHVLSG